MAFARSVRNVGVIGALLAAVPLSLSGPALADPMMDALATTPCTYAQVTAALNAQSPALATQLNGRPDMQANLEQFLALPVDQRQRQAAQQQAALPPQLQAILTAQLGPTVTRVASTCMNY